MNRTGLRFCHLALGIAIAVSGAACGNSSASLTGPSGASGGTRISGHVSGITRVASTTASTTAAASSVRVSIDGTGISTTVDASGNFTLTEVPPGSVQLTFHWSQSECQHHTERCEGW